METYNSHLADKPTNMLPITLKTQTTFIERIMSILDDKLTDPSFGVTEFSKRIGMSRMQLHRRLKASFGLSASHFLKLHRLQAASELLRTSDISVSQVGYTVGFNNHSYFTKRFKETYQCTPTDYIKKHAS